MWISQDTDFSDFELDEVYWFIGARKGYEMGINTYIMTMMTQSPRQILAFAVDNEVSAEAIESMAHSTEPAKRYFTDGAPVYTGVDFLGKHNPNAYDKSDTHNVEGNNADLRHYIAGLRRKSRCFFRRSETLKAVLLVFINAYNKFGQWKKRYFERNPLADRDVGFNHTRFI